MKKRISKRFVIILITLGNLVGLPLVVCAALVLSYTQMNIAWVLGLIAGLLLLLGSYLAWISLIYQIQRSVSENGAHPVREGIGNVISMFVWTTHWAYVTLRRFPEDYRNYAGRHQLEVPHLSSERFERWAFMAVLTGSLALVVAFPGNVKLASTICDAINAISELASVKRPDLHDISGHFRDHRLVGG